MKLIIDTLLNDFKNEKKEVENLIALHVEGNTVPFIARYRKELTGAMDETVIRNILERYEYLVSLEKRKEEVLKNIDEKGKLTDELKKSILKAKTLTEVEDIYAPYKSKRKTKADIAREFNIEPLAIFIRENNNLETLAEEAKKYINENVKDVETAITMARDILTEEIGHNVLIKSRLRELYLELSVIKSSKAKEVIERNSYEAYYDFEQPISKIPPHRILAIFRGEKENILKVKIEIEEETCLNAILTILFNTKYADNDEVRKSALRSYKSMLSSSIELEMRSDLRGLAEERAIDVFSENLKALLLTPPVNGKRIIGLDPAYRTGCKFAAIDEYGKLLDYGVIYPTVPQADYDGSKRKILDIIKKYDINAISIGNGTASRETEEFVAKVIEESGITLAYTIVNEAGASVYSASQVAIDEFPTLDLTIRGAVSIARRVIDPLAELVKIEPKSIGVGMYQHDVNAKKLEKTLSSVVEDVVNNIGVNLNTASASLLKYISGLNYALAQNIVRYRESEGRFNNREELLKVSGLGETTFKQCAGFLKIYDGNQALDKMFIHPESYDATYKLLEKCKVSVENAKVIRIAIKNIDKKKVIDELELGEYTFNDIVANLEKPDRDIRDSLDPIIFKKGVVSLDDIEIGTVLQGKVTNIVDFGAFIDVGLKNDGLIHISELADKFIKHPSEVVKVNDNLSVKVIEIDKARGRVSLSLK